MTDYDKTNSAAAFSPYQDQRLVLQGELDVDGNSHRIVVIQQPLGKGGEPRMVVYAKVAVLFPNDKNGNDKAPDFSGPVELIPGPARRIAAWKKMTEKAGKFLSMRISLKDDRPASNGDSASSGPSHEETWDDIPF